MFLSLLLYTCVFISYMYLYLYACSCICVYMHLQSPKTKKSASVKSKVPLICRCEPLHATRTFKNADGPWSKLATSSVQLLNHKMFKCLKPKNGEPWEAIFHHFIHFPQDRSSSKLRQLFALFEPPLAVAASTWRCDAPRSD